MMVWQALSDGALDGHPFKLSFPLCGNGLDKPLDSGLRRNDEMLVETSVMISACSRQAAMMIKIKIAGMLLSSRRHLWTGCPVCGERAGCPEPPGAGRNPGGRSRGMMEWQVLSDSALDGHPFKLSFPLRGNGLDKPLDSGLRLPAAGRPE